MIDMSSAAGFLPLVAAGCLVGFLIGLTGVGGGALMTPLLISTFGVAPEIAVGTDLCYACITKILATWRHHVARNVEWRIVFALAAGSIPAAVLLLAAIAYVPLDTGVLAKWIKFGLVGALPISALAIVLYPVLMRRPDGDTDAATGTRVLLTTLFGVVLGLLVTLTSVGSGAIGVSVLAALYPLLAARRVVGTDITHAVPLTLIGGLGHIGLGHVDFGLMAALLCGSIPGMLVGTRLAGIAPEWLLRPILAITLCYAAYTLYKK